jgi:hypothetical protein
MANSSLSLTATLLLTGPVHLLRFLLFDASALTQLLRPREAKEAWSQGPDFKICATPHPVIPNTLGLPRFGGHLINPVQFEGEVFNDQAKEGRSET